MSPAAERASDVIKRLPHGAVCGAEIGVWRGRMSSALLKRPDLCLYMVDDWRGKDEWPSGYRPQDMDANKDEALRVTEFAAERRTILHANSAQAANMVLNKSLDFVFLDADHAYESVKADMDAWRPKIKRGGLLGGHDYANRNVPGGGVKQAVDEAVEKNKWSLVLGCQSCWYVTV